MANKQTHMELASQRGWDVLRGE